MVKGFFSLALKSCAYVSEGLREAISRKQVTNATSNYFLAGPSPHGSVILMSGSVAVSQSGEDRREALANAISYCLISFCMLHSNSLKQREDRKLEKL